MDIIIYCIYIFVISILVSSFINIKLSLALYISYLILVPYLEFNIVGIPLSYNLVNTILLLAFISHFYKRKWMRINFKVIVPFFFFFFSLLFLSLLASDTPLEIQLNAWRIAFMQSCILSFIIWNTVLYEPKVLHYIKWAFMISIVIAGVYGIFLMRLGGLNPYTSFLAEYFDKKDIADIYSQTPTRLNFSTAAKIQSTMVHPMTWGLMLCFLFVLFLTLYLKTKNKFYWLFLCLISFNILISGVRTGIAALFFSFVYFLVRYPKPKVIAISILIVFALSVVVQLNEDVSNIFTSFSDVSGTKSEVKGSSISMRLDQLQGAVKVISNTPLVGKGYGWTSYYSSKHGDHPILLAFESLIFVVLCNSGILGVFVWVIFFFMLINLNRLIIKRKIDIYLLDALIIVYLSYAIGTGEYGYIQIFAIFYSYLIAYLYNERKMKIIRKNNVLQPKKQMVIRSKKVEISKSNK